MAVNTLPTLLRRRLEMNVRRTGLVGVALSGGIDSCSILAACLRRGMRPVVISYSPDTHESTDHRYARENAAALGLRFYSVPVDMSPGALETLARTVIRFGYKTKMQVESLAPMVRIAEAAKVTGVSVLYTGDQADGYYINGNWISRNYDRARKIPGPERKHVMLDKDSKRIDELRRIYWEEDRGNCAAVQSLCAAKGIRAIMPYRDERIAAAFSGTHWREVNEPRLKQPAWEAFPELGQSIAVRATPVNLHRGDSFFADVMGKRLMARFPGPWRTPVGLYAAMARGEV